MTEVDFGEALYQLDSQLIALFGKKPNLEGGREFAQRYAALRRDFYKQYIGASSIDGVDYFKIDASIWIHSVEQAEIGNFHPLRLRLQGDARELFEGSVDRDPESEETATALINLARSIV